MPDRKKRNFVLIGFGLLVISIIIFYFDKQIIQFISSLRNYYLSQFFLGIKFLDNEIFIVLFLTIILLLKKERKEWIFPLWMTMLITAIVNFVLKYFIQRPRPFIQGIVPLLPGIVDKISYHVWDFSFPSFDTALAFCAVPILSKSFPKLKYAWISFAVLVGLSRIYFGLHFLSDVILGGFIGFLIGIWIIKLEEKRHPLKKIYYKFFNTI